LGVAGDREQDEPSQAEALGEAAGVVVVGMAAVQAGQPDVGDYHAFWNPSGPEWAMATSKPSTSKRR
jgi:hypothetical protein